MVPPIHGTNRWATLNTNDNTINTAVIIFLLRRPCALILERKHTSSDIGWARTNKPLFHAMSIIVARGVTVKLTAFASWPVELQGMLNCHQAVNSRAVHDWEQFAATTSEGCSKDLARVPEWELEVRWIEGPLALLHRVHIVPVEWEESINRLLAGNAVVVESGN